MNEQHSSRKKDHLKICINEDVNFKKTTLFEQVELMHSALPEFSFNEIDTSITFLGRQLKAPLIIGSMSGGTNDKSFFNKDLAIAAQNQKIGLALGSMRPALEDRSLLAEFKVRQYCPDVALLANIGAGQLSAHEHEELLDLSHKLHVDGLIVHLNAGMEIIQPEGDNDFSNILDQIASLVKKAGTFPIIVKETGMGFSSGDGYALQKAGIKILETGSAGGTSWVAVESYRTNEFKKKMADLLWDFGVPSAVCTAYMSKIGFETIASGGIKNGLDTAKAIALGACAVALARPVLLAYEKAKITAVEMLLEEIAQGLRYVMLCCGAKNILQLKKTPKVLGLSLKNYLEAMEIK
jgi:isopentenyl-diphosphate Delta-isomerase